MEKNLVLESCFKSGIWGLLDMYILLTDDIVAFDESLEEQHPLDVLREFYSVSSGVTQMDIKLYRSGHQDLLLSFLIARCPNLKSLNLSPKNTLDTALEKFCAAMPYMTILKLSCVNHRKNNYSGVLRAISANMPHLRCLDISYCMVEPKAIEYLLPTEDNALGGCPELVDLDLWGIENVDVALLKKIILALPQLISLRHELLINALGKLINKEMGVDTARSMNKLYASDTYYWDVLSWIDYDILVNSPVFQRINKNITIVDLDVVQEDIALLADVLMSLPNLRRISVCGISLADEHLLPVLESIGDRLQHLRLKGISGNLSVHDIMKTCRNLILLTLSKDDSLGNGNNIHHNEAEMSIVPDCLEQLHLERLPARMCSADMLIALLQAPRLNQFYLNNVEVMSDDVMLNALSARTCSGLAKVIKCKVFRCPSITATPFVHWLAAENCSLQFIHYFGCEKIDNKILVAAAEKCHRALVIDQCTYDLYAWL